MPVMRTQPERLDFIDETSVKTNLTRLRGRALRGQRLQMDAPFGNWGTQTFIVSDAPRRPAEIDPSCVRARSEINRSR